MPIYEYRCTRCGHELEQMQKISDPAPDPCPKCGAAQAMEKLVSRSAFHLKGGGWYSDLYGSTKKDSGSGGTSASATGTAASGTTSSTPSSTAGATTSSAPSTSSASSGTSSGSSGGSSSGSSGSSSSGKPS